MIVIVFGTRPEIIKFSPLIRALQKNNLPFFIIHTNQHYSKILDEVFLEELELPKAKYNLNTGSGLHGEMTGKMLAKIESVLIKEKPSVVVVEGDTNSVLAGALAATKLHIPVAHIEAGLRSYYRMMPEEINRVLTDHMSDILFAPTKLQKSILQGEGISAKNIKVVGNTIVDAVHEHKKISEKRSTILSDLCLEKDQYFLTTFHREENVDNESRFKSMIQALNKVSKKHDLPVIYPIHPRAAKKLSEFNIDKGVIRIIEPVGYLDFLRLMTNARLILTDSGGVQEEACILQVPCVTLRDNTERDETIKIGSNIIGGVAKNSITGAVNKMLKKKRNWKHPYGTGNTGEKIAKTLSTFL